MKRLLAVAAVAAAAAATAVPAAAATRTVRVGDDSFRPARVSVHPSTKVTWKWTGGLPHNVTVVKGPRKFHSRTQTSGRYSVRPRKKGTYRIVCTIHGFSMKLVVR